MIREKRTKSGKLFEIDFFPVWNDGRRMPSRSPKSRVSTPEQERYNRRQAEKKLVRLVNVNFDEGDIIMHPTYSQDKAPQNEAEARRDIVNYLRRVKGRRETELKKVRSALEALPQAEALRGQKRELEIRKAKLEAPFRYIYVIEKAQYKTGKYKGRNNWHFHLFVTGGLSRRELERMWPNGMRTNADNFQPEKYGPQAIAKYMSKDTQGSKHYCCSRNLEKPKVLKPRDGKISPRGVERLARERIEDRAYWERRCKGYRFVEAYARYNEYNGHWYLSVTMYEQSASD